MTQKKRRLLVFGLASFASLSLLAFGLYLPYINAYGFVHAVRTVANRAPQTPYQNIQFTTSDGLTLKGWYIPPRNGALVIFVHGKNGNRSGFVDEAELIAAAGYGALLFDLRSHGESEGNVTTLGLDEVRDVEAAVAFARQSAGPNTPVALLGQSLGGATVLLAAVNLPEVRAVIAESAYTSVEDNITEGVRKLIGLPPVPFAPLVVFFGEHEAGVRISDVRPLEVVDQISPRALLLIHGELDDVVLVENAHRLYAAAREPKELYILPNAGHGGFLQAAPEEYPRRILAFLEKYLRPVK